MQRGRKGAGPRAHSVAGSPPACLMVEPPAQEWAPHETSVSGKCTQGGLCLSPQPDGSYVSKLAQHLGSCTPPRPAPAHGARLLCSRSPAPLLRPPPSHPGQGLTSCRIWLMTFFLSICCRERICWNRSPISAMLPERQQIHSLSEHFPSTTACQAPWRGDNIPFIHLTILMECLWGPCPRLGTDREFCLNPTFLEGG